VNEGLAGFMGIAEKFDRPDGFGRTCVRKFVVDTSHR
jgi:hypothetical protein